MVALYSYNGIDFPDVTAASGSGDQQIESSSAPGVAGSVDLLYGERGESYILTMFLFEPEANIEGSLSVVIKAVNEQGPHILKWRGRSFNASLRRHSFGPYVRTAAGQRVRLTLEFKTPSVSSDGRS